MAQHEDVTGLHLPVFETKKNIFLQLPHEVSSFMEELTRTDTVHTVDEMDRETVLDR